jgi:hypothetical protein
VENTENKYESRKEDKESYNPKTGHPQLIQQSFWVFQSSKGQQGEEENELVETSDEEEEDEDSEDEGDIPNSTK